MNVNFDRCALFVIPCVFMIWVFVYLSLAILGCILVLCNYIHVALCSHRKKKKTEFLDDKLEQEVQSQEARRYKNIRHVYQTWHTIPLCKRIYWILHYAVFLSLAISTIGLIMLIHRSNYLANGEGLTDEQRALVAKAHGPYTFLWQQELAEKKAWLEWQLRKRQAWNETLAKLHDKSTASPAKTLDQMPNQQTATTVADAVEPKVAAVETGQTSGAEFLDETTNMFQQLVGYKVPYYTSQKSSTFDITGNLNFWKYFQLQSLYQNLTHLRRSVPLEEDKTMEDVFFLSDLNPVRLSADGQFLLYDSLMNGPDFERLTRSHKVTIATQTSMDRLLAFVDSYEHWTGPISAAVFLKGPLEYFLLRSYLQYLKHCHPKHHRQTRFSIATPFEDPIPRNILIETKTFEKFDCKSKSDEINVVFKKQLDETNAWLQVKYYPQNMMRNLARANIETDYHLTLDVDIVPCVGMSEKLNKFLNESLVASALVIPTYEVSRKIAFPRTKRELIDLTKKKLAQPFHKDIFATNQNATNFPKWEMVHDSFEDVHVVHEVRKFPIFYEPFFVELQSNPLFDETFVGYGFTRSSHAFEVFVRNGNFLVLSPIFTAELGIKKVKDWSAFRQQQNESNRKRFNHFIANITSQFTNVQELDDDSSTSYYLRNSGNYTTFA